MTFCDRFRSVLPSLIRSAPGMARSASIRGMLSGSPPAAFSPKESRASRISAGILTFFATDALKASSPPLTAASLSSGGTLTMGSS